MGSTNSFAVVKNCIPVKRITAFSCCVVSICSSSRSFFCVFLRVSYGILHRWHGKVECRIVSRRRVTVALQSL